eukprot:11072137-Karenia_brevis.AAC.1
MTQGGNRVVFDSEDAYEGSYIENKSTGHKIYLRQENGVYVMDMWVMPADMASDFTRQAGINKCP